MISGEGKRLFSNLTTFFRSLFALVSTGRSMASIFLGKKRNKTAKLFEKEKNTQTQKPASTTSTKEETFVSSEWKKSTLAVKFRPQLRPMYSGEQKSFFSPPFSFHHFNKLVAIARVFWLSPPQRLSKILPCKKGQKDAITRSPPVSKFCFSPFLSSFIGSLPAFFPTLKRGNHTLASSVSSLFSWLNCPDAVTKSSWSRLQYIFMEINARPELGRPFLGWL